MTDEMHQVSEGVMAIEVPKNEAISGGRNGGRKGVSFAICWGKANRGGVHIKKWERGRVVKRDVDPYIIRLGINQRKRGSRNSRER